MSTGFGASGCAGSVKTLEASSLGALLTFDFANIRYMTATHIGTWAMDKLIRFAVLPRGGDPVVWDFGSAARHHQLFNPWLDGEKRARAGISTLRGAFHPDAGVAEEVAHKVAAVLREHGLEGEPVGVDVVEMPILAALRAEGLEVVDGQQVFLEARRIKTADEIGLLTQACSMVDAAYEELYSFLRPGVRENECVGVVSKVLYDLGSEYVEGVNAISGERCSPHPHVYSDRVVRPGDPAFFDILHSHLGYRTCYYRCFAGGQRVAGASATRTPDCREYMDMAIAAVKPGATTADIVRLAACGGVRLRRREAAFALQYGHGVGLSIWEKPIFSRTGLAGPSRDARGGHGLRPRDVLAGIRRLVGGTHRGGGGRHRRRLRGHHEVPRRGASRCRPALLDVDGPLPAVCGSRSRISTQPRDRGEP